MHKHLQHLERISQKMQSRYWDSDDLVLQLKHEVKSFEAKNSSHPVGANLGRRKDDCKEAFRSPR